MVNEQLSLFEFYAKMLSSAKLVVQPDGSVHIDDGAGSVRPLTINNAKMVIPTAELLQSSQNLVGKIVFHPVWEGAVRKESTINKRLKQVFQARLQYVIGSLLEELLTIATDVGKHSLLSPEQSSFLSIIPDADEKTRDALTDIIRKLSDDKKLITINIKRGGRWKNKEWHRLAVVTFPITDDKAHNEKVLLGVKVPSKRVKEEILNLFEYILPNSQLVETYSFGTDEKLAPNFVSLMGAYHQVAQRLNEMVTFFKSVLSDPHDLITDLSWYEQSGDISRYRTLAPMFPGNEGDPVEGVSDVPAAVQPTATPAAIASTITPPVTQLKPLTIGKPMNNGGNASTSALQPLPTATGLKPVQPMEKWTDAAKKMVGAGTLPPVNKMADVMLNNPGATNVVVVDQNGNPVQLTNPQVAMQQAQQQALYQQYYQMFAQYCMTQGINLAGMTQDQINPMFQMWVRTSGIMNNMMPTNGMPMNGAFQQPMMNGFNQPMMNGFGTMGQTDPFQVPGRVALQQRQQMNAFANNTPRPLQFGFNNPFQR